MTFTAVFFDFGGVILTSPFDAFNRYEAELGVPPDLIRTINATDPDTNAWARLERSEVSVEEFVLAFEAEARAAGHELHGQRVLDCLSGEVRPEMVEALDRVNSRYVTACLTNNVAHGDGPGMARDASRAAEIEAVMARFDHVVESSRVGVRKPDPAFYEIALETAGVRAEEVVFLDDLGVNLKPARALGMTTIKVGSADQAIADLEAVLDMTLR